MPDSRDSPTDPEPRRQFIFPEFIERLRAALVATASSGMPEPRKTLLRARQLFEECVRKCEPLSARMTALVGQIKSNFDTLDGLLSGRLSPPPRRVFDPLVHFLLFANCQHAVETAGRDAANAELRAMVNDLTKGARGRRPRIALQQVQEAMRLRETEGLSFAEAATRVGLDAQDARALTTAVRWHFPPQNKSS